MAPASCFRGLCRAASAAFLLTALLAPAAHGADKKPAPPPPAPKTPLLTQEQLRDCLAQKDKVAKETEAALKSRTEVDAQKAEIDSSGKALADEATTLDRTSEGAVAAYNAGAGGAIKGFAGGDVDANTAHGDYSADVMARRDAVAGASPRAPRSLK